MPLTPYVVRDAAGIILRSGFSAEPDLQTSDPVAEPVLVIVGGDGATISDVNVRIDVETGAFEAAPGYSGDLPAGEPQPLEAPE